MIITAQTIPSNFQFNFLINSATDELRIIQCVPTRAIVITNTKMIGTVGNKAVPWSALPNIEDRSLHAVVKSAERKNTQAMVTKKNTNNVFTKRTAPNEDIKDGSMEALATCFPSNTGIQAGVCSWPLFLICWISLSMHR